MNDKIIFLDIDGVMIPMRDKLSEESFDLACVDRLNLLLAVSGAGIVVSSSKRHELGADLFKYLVNNGVAIDTDRYLGVTPDDPDDRRGYEISEWIRSHNFKGQFVILDDDDQMDPLMDYLVNTQSEFGLMNDDLSDALAVLRDVV